MEQHVLEKKECFLFLSLLKTVLFKLQHSDHLYLWIDARNSEHYILNYIYFQ